MATTKLHNQTLNVDGGELDERLPPITSGLIAHYPLKGNPSGFSYNSNLVESKGVWVAGGTGSVGTFSQNGETAANKRILKANPWGGESVVWATETNDADSNADGGWNNYNNSIDRTKTYRLSVWIRRENAGNGRSYFGCQGSTVTSLGSSTANTNPYFTNFLVGSIVQDEWVLLVGYIHPHDYSGSSLSTNGVYKKDGTRLIGCTDYKWTSSATVGGHRSYLYYSTSTTERQYWYDPRMEIYDPSVSSTTDDLLSGSPDILHPLTNTDTTQDFDGLGISETSTNLANTSWKTSWANSGSYSYSSSIKPKNVPYRNLTVNSITMTASGEVSLGVGTVSSTTPSTAHTVSVWYYFDIASTMTRPYIRHNNSNVGNLKWIGNNSSDYTTWPQKEWILLYGAFTSDGAGSTVYISSYLATIGDFEAFNAPQIVQKNKMTPFINGSRTTPSQFRARMLPNLQTYSVVGKFIPSSNFNGTYTYTANSSALFRVLDTKTTGNMYYRYYVSGSNSAPYLDPDGSFGTNHTHGYYDIDAYKELTFVITKTSTTFTTRLYQNGAWKSTHTDTLSTNNYMTDFLLGSTTIWNGTYSDLSFYNKVLTSDEMNKMVQSTNTLNDDSLIVEIDENIDENIYPDPNMLNTTYDVNGTGAVTIKNDSYGRYHEKVVSNQTWTYEGKAIPSEAGEIYIVSGWFWVSIGNTFNYRPLVIEQAQSVLSYDYTSYSECPEGEWFYASAKCISDGSFNMIVYPTTSTAGSGTIKWRNLCVRKESSTSTKLNDSNLELGEFNEY